MTRNLVHKCRYCKTAIYAVEADGEITDLLNAKFYMNGAYEKSQKIFICQGDRREKMSGIQYCGREFKRTSLRPVIL